MNQENKTKQTGTNGGDHLQELEQELKHLRAVVREAGENFILRREGEIETILSYLASLSRKSVREELPEWLRELHRLKLKPAKGRLKDLREIDRTIEILTDRLINAQKIQPKSARNRSAAAIQAAESAE
ncbi:hypothetical protein [Geobacter pickeringii]|uniref:Uncharacterized protein n=1 Tax=Geobacter pickeringii TaxID=345632 RepID=A0A0B5B8T7_9BACT|nr:hypothetical protein [Geobacter pickeringii]AJE03123.1 hypothetical protein GPICK_06855 [Geobacter pickeringii]